MYIDSDDIYQGRTLARMDKLAVVNIYHETVARPETGNSSFDTCEAETI